MQFLPLTALHLDRIHIHFCRHQRSLEHITITKRAGHFLRKACGQLCVKEIVLSYNFADPAITQDQHLQFKLMELYQDSGSVRRFKSIVQRNMELPTSFVWPVRRDAVAVNHEGLMGSVSYRSETRWKLETSSVWARAYAQLLSGNADSFHGGSRLEAVVTQGPETVLCMKVSNP